MATTLLRILRRRVAAPMLRSFSSRPLPSQINAAARPTASRMEVAPPLPLLYSSRRYSCSKVDGPASLCRRCCCCCCCCCRLKQAGCPRNMGCGDTTSAKPFPLGCNRGCGDTTSAKPFPQDLSYLPLIDVSCNKGCEKGDALSDRFVESHETMAASQEKIAHTLEMVLKNSAANNELSRALLEVMIKGSQQTTDDEHWVLGAVEAISTWSEPYFPWFGTLKGFTIMVRNPEFRKAATHFFEHTGMDQDVQDAMEELRREGRSTAPDILVLSDGGTTGLEASLPRTGAHAGEEVNKGHWVERHAVVLFWLYYLVHVGAVCSYVEGVKCFI